ncbi:MAG: heavy-metal-associated domain-containing protein [Gammaproteobacteria bacterium]|jgi:hypothetical protein|nr:heavy-metal-associated domain-containing protein [Gammaproteobacteria bacterium]
MTTYNANVIVHIDELLSSNQLCEMEVVLSEVTGVVSSCVHERTPHLLVVDYDSRAVHSGTLLGHIKDGGLHAELVGGI